MSATTDPRVRADDPNRIGAYQGGAYDPYTIADLVMRARSGDGNAAWTLRQIGYWSPSNTDLYQSVDDWARDRRLTAWRLGTPPPQSGRPGATAAPAGPTPAGGGGDGWSRLQAGGYGWMVPPPGAGQGSAAAARIGSLGNQGNYMGVPYNAATETVGWSPDGKRQFAFNWSAWQNSETAFSRVSRYAREMLQARPDWTADQAYKAALARVKRQVGDRQVGFDFRQVDARWETAPPPGPAGPPGGGLHGGGPPKTGTPPGGAPAPGTPGSPSATPGAPTGLQRVYYETNPEAYWFSLARQAAPSFATPRSQWAQRDYGRAWGDYLTQSSADPSLQWVDYAAQQAATLNTRFNLLPEELREEDSRKFNAGRYLG